MIVGVFFYQFTCVVMWSCACVFFIKPICMIMCLCFLKKGGFGLVAVCMFGIMLSLCMLEMYFEDVCVRTEPC